MLALAELLQMSYSRRSRLDTHWMFNLLFHLKWPVFWSFVYVCSFHVTGILLLLLLLHMGDTVDLCLDLFQGPEAVQGRDPTSPYIIFCWINFRGWYSCVNYCFSIIKSCSSCFVWSFRSTSREAENPGNNLYVTGLSPRITKRELEKHFAAEGKVCSSIHLILVGNSRYLIYYSFEFKYVATFELLF